MNSLKENEERRLMIVELEAENERLKEQNARFEEAYKRLLEQVHYMKTLDYSLGLILD